MKWILGIGLGALCNTGCQDFRDCNAVDVSGNAGLPLLLSQTGLYADIATDALSDAVIAFEPSYKLWTDGAEKRRWILLPDGAQVKTQNDEAWSYPIGTKFFKEFSRDGVRVETRMNLNTEQGWLASSYLWRQNEAEADRVVEAIENALGTAHDIPSSQQCYACHGGRDNFALGFSAVQLDVETKAQMHVAGLFSAQSTSTVELKDTIKNGLGVLHANCSHCHNTSRNQNPQSTECYNPIPEEDFDLSLQPNIRFVDEAPAVLTARNELLGGEILNRMSQRNTSNDNPSMPPLGTELVDHNGIEAVEQMISALRAEGI